MPLSSALLSAGRRATFLERKLLDTELAYLAGFLDGEGTIGLFKTSGANAFKVPCISVSSTDRYLLDAYVHRFGGHIQTKASKRPENHRQAYEYRLRGPKAICAISELFPYLRHHVKRARATMILEHFTKITKRNGKYTEAERAIKIRWEELFLSLSSRGGDAWTRDYQQFAVGDDDRNSDD
ncbi:hypothetical protein LAV_00110 [Sphingobium phage Lacusarx]|uniref:Homing endonuclease LAGLIDADG domain-containing protein n=1 Tax=Sphingobium phage Lacusarx TaxID=1980139 RepID=A0A1W6DX99_9CAUD|nr:HNH endonuclease [Sphingobium phage Lacusarx]ARK07486.1 hypothetical protein LAV_00110 [Sphingobium phage Lacusarx]